MEEALPDVGAVVAFVEARRQREFSLRVEAADAFPLADAALHVMVAVEKQVRDAAAVRKASLRKDLEPHARDLLQFRHEPVVREIAADQDAVDAPVAEVRKRRPEQGGPRRAFRQPQRRIEQVEV